MGLTWKQYSFTIHVITFRAKCDQIVSTLFDQQVAIEKNQKCQNGFNNCQTLGKNTIKIIAKDLKNSQSDEISPNLVTLTLAHINDRSNVQTASS